MNRSDFRNSSNAREIIEFVFKVYANKHGERKSPSYHEIKKGLKNKLPSDKTVIAQHKAWINDPINFLSKDHPIYKLAQVFYGHPVELKPRQIHKQEYGIISESMKISVIENVPLKDVNIGKLKHGFNDFCNYEIPEEVLSLIKDKQKMFYLEERKRGTKGVDIGVRLFIFIISQVPLKYRGENTRCDIRITLRDLAKLIFPRDNEKGYFYKKSMHEETLREGLKQLHTVEVELQDKRLFRPVIVRTEPDYANLESKAVFEVLWPSNSDYGMRINLKLLIEEGIRNKWKFNFNLALSKYWDDGKRKNNGNRVYHNIPVVERNKAGYIIDSYNDVIKDKNGIPVSSWNHPRAIRRYDAEGKPIIMQNPSVKHLAWLTYDDLYEMAFSTVERTSITNPKTIRQMKYRVHEYVNQMQEQNWWRVIKNDSGNAVKIVELYINSTNTAIAEW